MLSDFLTYPYQVAVESRLWLYKRGWFKAKRLPCPVVSVGNLTVGGTGKTPITMWVARYLAAKGRRVAILSRGYRRRSQEKFLLVSNGQTILADPTQSGDEPYLMATRCPGVLVAVGTDRYELGLWVLEQYPVECFVLDDGFQHVNLERDVNLLLVDVSDSTGMQALLPLGRLREPLWSARRATEIIFTRVEDPPMLLPVKRALESAMNREVVPIATRFDVHGLMGVHDDNTADPSWLNGKRVLLFSGVAKAQSVRRLVEGLGAKIVEELVYPDHMDYSEKTIQRIHEQEERANAEVCVTTEKDLVKVKPLWPSTAPLWALSLGITFLEGQDRLEFKLNSIFNS